MLNLLFYSHYLHHFVLFLMKGESRPHTSLVSYMDFRLYNRSKCPNTLIEGPVFYKQAFVNLDFTLEVILSLSTQSCICLC